MKKKYVLITGSSRGIGRACAVAFAKNGYHVFINCKNSVEQLAETEHEILASGGGCTALPGDVSDPDVVRSIFCKIKKVCQGVDVLVNNAGITNDKLLLRMTQEDFMKVVDTNLLGTFHFTKYAAAHMAKKRYGRIINLSSISAVRGNAGQANYCASKAGVIGMTLSNSKELGKRNITVNAIAPGFIETDMTTVLSEKQKELVLGQISLGRYGKAEDVAKAAAFLASDGAAYITGQVIGVDGGMIL